MGEPLCERLKAAPVLPARTRAEPLVARELLERLHDAETEAALVAHFSGYPAAQDLVAGQHRGVDPDDDADREHHRHHRAGQPRRGG